MILDKCLALSYSLFRNVFWLRGHTLKMSIGGEGEGGPKICQVFVVLCKNFEHICYVVGLSVLLGYLFYF